jgi:hypothetical protein
LVVDVHELFLLQAVPFDAGRITLKKVEGIRGSRGLETSDAHVAFVLDRQALLFQAAHLTVDRVGFVLEFAVAGTIGGDPPIIEILGMNDEAVKVGTRALEYGSEPMGESCDGTRGVYWLSMNGDEVREVVDPIAVCIRVHEPFFALFDPFCRAPQPVTDRDLEIGVVDVELEVVRGPLESVLISHEAVSQSLHLF